MRKNIGGTMNGAFSNYVKVPLKYIHSIPDNISYNEISSRKGKRKIDLTLWHSIIIGVMQGVTEFIPVSSSGHLILLYHLLGVNNQIPVLFDILLRIIIPAENKTYLEKKKIDI